MASNDNREGRRTFVKALALGTVGLPGMLACRKDRNNARQNVNASGPVKDIVWAPPLTSPETPEGDCVVLDDATKTDSGGILKLQTGLTELLIIPPADPNKKIDITVDFSAIRKPDPEELRSGFKRIEEKYKDDPPAQYLKPGGRYLRRDEQDARRGEIYQILRNNAGIQLTFEESLMSRKGYRIIASVEGNDVVLKLVRLKKAPLEWRAPVAKREKLGELQKSEEIYGTIRLKDQSDGHLHIRNHITSLTSTISQNVLDPSKAHLVDRFQLFFDDIDQFKAITGHANQKEEIIQYHLENELAASGFTLKDAPEDAKAEAWGKAIKKEENDYKSFKSAFPVPFPNKRLTLEEQALRDRFKMELMKSSARRQVEDRGITHSVAGPPVSPMETPVPNSGRER